MNESPSAKKLTRFDWVIFVLSIYVVVELYLNLVLDYSATMTDVSHGIDLAICLVFLGDFFWRLWKAEKKLVFLKFNWVDFVSSIPMVGVLRIGRAARIFRVLRLIRSGKVFYSLLGKQQAISTFQTVLLGNLLLVLLAAVAMHHLEHGVNPFFVTFGDAVWWSTVTTATLGFVSDVAPVTAEGKVVSLILMAGGLALFGTFTAMVADYFIGDEDILEEVKKVNARLDRIEEKLDRLLK